MAFKTLLLAAAAALTFTGSTATTAVAGDAAKAGKSTICHRTGAKTPTGRFRGHLITVSNNAVAAHTAHGDAVVVDPEILEFLRVSGGCALSVDGDLYDVTGSDFLQAAPEPTTPAHPPKGGHGPG